MKQSNWGRLSNYPSKRMIMIVMVVVMVRLIAIYNRDGLKW